MQGTLGRHAFWNPEALSWYICKILSIQENLAFWKYLSFKYSENED